MLHDMSWEAKVRVENSVTMILRSLCLALLFPAALCSQNSYWQRDDLALNPSGLDLQDARSWAWGDLDQDGWPDIVIVRRADNGPGRLISFRGQDTTEPPYWLESGDLLSGISDDPELIGISIADLDGNGRLNLITMVREQSENFIHPLFWKEDADGKWESDSNVFDSIQITSNDFRANDPSFADVDGDGDLDMLIGSTPENGRFNVQFFENIGTEVSPLWQEDSTRLRLVLHNPPGFNVGSPALMHLNDDSLIDLAVAFDIEGFQGASFYPGAEDTTGLFWLDSFQGLFDRSFDASIQKLLPYDVTADGHDDLLLLEYATGRVYPFRESTHSLERAGFFRFGPPRFPLRSSAILLDHDNDSKVELLTFGQIFGFTADLTTVQAYEKKTLSQRELWRTTGWFEPPRDFSDAFQFKAQLGDLDGNKFSDLVISLNGQSQFGSSFLAFESSSDSSFQSWNAKNELIVPFLSDGSRQDTTYSDPSFTDVDDDGDQDLLLVQRIFGQADTSAGKYIFFENELVGNTVTWVERTDWLPGLDTRILHHSNFVDLDRDNDPDLAFGTELGTLMYYENVGTSKAPRWQADESVFSGIDVGSPARPSFGDLSGDGRADLIVGNDRGELFYYQNDFTVFVGTDLQPIPATFSLGQNYPNPFNPETTIAYMLPDAGVTFLTIYNLLGQSIATLVDGWQSAGEHRVTWDGKNDHDGQRVASGIYLYELALGTQVRHRKMVLVR